ncbi:hypothetical protein ABC270_08190 [Curtobacterium sp. 1P10AnD]|uniref:hypothetical protein n=1 Tax=Curtobacterium sp. 1P10AnD TaxID=3132283 RepID=UPI00399F6FA6
MAALKVSYSTLDQAFDALDDATSTFSTDSMPSDGGSFGADDVAQAFAAFRTAQQRSAAWLADTSRTLAQFAHDTKSQVADADLDLARKAGTTK